MRRGREDSAGNGEDSSKGSTQLLLSLRDKMTL